MKPVLICIGLSGLSSLACTAPEGGGREARLDVGTAANERVSVVEAGLERAGQSPSARLEAEPVEGGLDPYELDLWNDPAFKRRFAQSYLAETDIEPRVTSVEREQMLEVMELISTNKLGKAVEMLQKNGGPATSAVFDFTLANIHMQQEHEDLAEAAYRVAVDKYPKFRRAWGNLGQLCFRQGRFAEVAEALTRVISLGGGDGTTYGLLGYCYLSFENPLSAESAYRMALLLEPADKRWKIGLAQCLFKQRRFGEAVTYLDTLIADDPDRSELWVNQGNAYIGLGQPMRAAENFELVDRMGHSTADSLNLLGDIYVNEELFELAASAYRRALVEKDGSPTRALRAGRDLVLRGALNESGDLLATIEERGQALDADQQMELLRLRARMAVARGAGDEEARILEEIVRLDPLDGEALILLGQFEVRNGRQEEAIFHFERAASLEKFEADAKILHAEVLVKQGKFAQALPLLRRAQALRPRDHIQSYLEDVERRAQGR